MKKSLSILGILFFILLLPMVPAGSATTHPHPTSIVTQFSSLTANPSPTFQDVLPVPEPYNLAPVSGILRLLVVAAEFSDVNHTKSIDEIKQSFKTVSDYYSEVSYGTISLQVDVHGWYRLPQPIAYYGKDCRAIDDADCSGNPTTWELARDAIPLVQKDVSFANYNYFIFLHSGFGQETSKNKNDIWSVAYLTGISSLLPYTEKLIEEFDIDPELEAGGSVPIGVYCEEFGHLLGLPDLYNTYTGKTIVGPWTLMDKGTWNGDPRGSSPADLEAWSKIKLGWIKGGMLAVVNDSSAGNFTVQPTEVPSNGIHVLEIPVSKGSHPPQYYLVEVRQHIGFDAGLPATGVLISYIEENKYNGKVTIIDAHPTVLGLGSATWEVGQTFTDDKNNIAIAIAGQAGISYQVIVNRLRPMRDLAVAKIFTEPSEINPNQTITIYVDIVNQGTADAANVPVQISLDDQPLSNTQVSVNAGATAELSVSWVAIFGSHLLKVAIDPLDTLNELTRANNVATYTLNVGINITNNNNNNNTNNNNTNNNATGVPLTVLTGNSTTWVRINGIQFTGNGSTQVTATVQPGTVTVEVEPYVYESTGTRQVFMNWSDGNSSNPRSVTVTSQTSLRAIYKTQFLLTVNRNGGVATLGGWFDANSSVTITATNPSNITQSQSRMIFTNWSGDANANSGAIRVNVTKPMNLIANWKTQYFLNVLSSVGTVTGTGWYDEGSPATISVQSTIVFPNSTREVFTGWNGGLTSNQTTTTISVNSPSVVVASWKLQYLVQILSPYGNPQGSGWQDAGGSVQVNIAPEVDYSNGTRRVFTAWRGDYTNASPNFVLRIDGPKTLIAGWTTQYELTFKVSGIPNSTYVTLIVNNVGHDVSASQPYRDWFSRGQQVDPVTNQTVGGFYQFVGWHNSTGGAVTTPFYVNGPQDYTATYGSQFPLLAVPGFPVESILIGAALGLITVAIAKRRRLKA